MTVIELLYFGMTILLIMAGIALLVPAVRGVQAVVYRRAMFALGISTLVFVLGWIINYALYYTGAQNPTIGWYIYLVSGVTHIYAVWLCARDFVAFESQDSESFEITQNRGGFDTDGDG